MLVVRRECHDAYSDTHAAPTTPKTMIAAIAWIWSCAGSVVTRSAEEEQEATADVDA